MSSWRVARSLDVLLAQYNSAFPGRGKSYDGSVGDLRHQKTKSDHNPGPDGIVQARDYTASKSQGDFLANAAIKTMLARGQKGYVIWQGRIANPSIGRGKWRRYTGTNPHNHHVHVSVHTQIDNGGEWNLGPSGTVLTEKGREAGVPVPTAPLKVTGKLDAATVKQLQRYLKRRGLDIGKGGADGQLGKDTIKALQQWIIDDDTALPRYGADGSFGAEAARALEQTLGLKAEKIPGWYPGLVRGLQRWLNTEIKAGRL